MGSPLEGINYGWGI